jgi:hypothetical protein
LRQSRAAFEQIIFNAFNGNTIWQKCAKMCCSVQKLQLKICSKISAEMLVKQNSTFYNIYFVLAPLRIAQIHW